MFVCNFKLRLQNFSKTSLGFSLIELIISLAILGLLATLATPLIELTIKRQKEQELRKALQEIRVAIDAYKIASDEGKIERKADETGYPPNLKVLYEGVLDATDTKNNKIYFLRRLPREPFYPDNNAAVADTWGKRSYASEYNQPKEGKDVYDVYSLSPDNALDDTAYSEW